MRCFVGRMRSAGNQDFVAASGATEGREVTVELRSIVGWIQGWARAY